MVYLIQDKCTYDFPSVFVADLAPDAGAYHHSRKYNLEEKYKVY